jgi:hypothetical protein
MLLAVCTIFTSQQKTVQSAYTLFVDVDCPCRQGFDCFVLSKVVFLNGN